MIGCVQVPFPVVKFDLPMQTIPERVIVRKRRTDRYTSGTISNGPQDHYLIDDREMYAHVICKDGGV